MTALDSAPSSPCSVAATSPSHSPRIDPLSSSHLQCPRGSISSASQLMSAVAQRRPSLTPSQCRRSSRCSPEPHIASNSRKSISGPSLAQLLQKGTKPSSVDMPSNGSQSMKRKLEEELGAAFNITSPSEVVLPTDPTRRASIINLATAAAAAVLQGQDAQRRFSLQPEQQNKRQRTRFQQLGLLAEQARLARAGSISMEKAQEVESAITAVEGQAAAVAANARVDAPSTLSNKPESSPAPSNPLLPADTATIGLPATGLSNQHQQEWAETISKEGFLDEAKMVANQYGRFYRFEQEWAQKVLAFESSRSVSRDNSSESLLEHDVRRASDPCNNAYVNQTYMSAEPEARDAQSTVSPLQAGVVKSEPGSKVVTPLELSRAASRIQSRAQSPMSTALEQAVSSKATPPSSKRPSNAGPSQGLVAVLSNFAELLEARQQVCSGLEALANQAKELPMAATTANVSHSVETTTAAATLSSDSDSDMMSDCSEADLVDRSGSDQVKDEREDSPKRQRVSMSIASMI